MPRRAHKARVSDPARVEPEVNHARVGRAVDRIQKRRPDHWPTNKLKATERHEALVRAHCCCCCCCVSCCDVLVIRYVLCADVWRIVW